MIDRNKEQVYDRTIEPFRLAGNVYFVGTHAASTHLIDTGDGLILIDSGYLASLYLVVDGIHRLGFDPADIKYIVHTHAHGDHAEATPALLKLCPGAKTVIGHKDAPVADEKLFDVDITVKDGDVLTLGNTSITFLETPGHTIGTVSPFFDVTEDGKIYKVGMFGGAGVNTLRKERLGYETCREDYYASLERLRTIPVDIFIGNHVWNNNTEKFGEILRTTGENKFINPSAWVRFLDSCKIKLDELIESEKDPA